MSKRSRRPNREEIKEQRRKIKKQQKQLREAQRAEGLKPTSCPHRHPMPLALMTPLKRSMKDALKQSLDRCASLKRNYRNCSKI
jgi:hypothetical protein